MLLASPGARIVFPYMGTSRARDGAMTNVVQVAISTFFVLLWLYLWKRMTTKIFWGAIRNNQNK